MKLKEFGPPGGPRPKFYYVDPPLLSGHEHDESTHRWPHMTGEKLETVCAACFISLHIRSMWETICDAWACWSGWKFGPNSTEYPYSKIQFQNTPPPPKNENCQRSWHFDFSVSEYPSPPPTKLKFRQILALCHFSVSEYPPPPQNWNLGRSWHFVNFQFQNTPSPPKI